eukprot:2417294-Rhodomonas_salina.4
MRVAAYLAGTDDSPLISSLSPISPPLSFPLSPLPHFPSPHPPPSSASPSTTFDLTETLASRPYLFEKKIILPEKPAKEKKEGEDEDEEEEEVVMPEVFPPGTLLVAAYARYWSATLSAYALRCRYSVSTALSAYELAVPVAHIRCYGVCRRGARY